VRASVVVIGGGAIGTSVAFHLAEAGVEDLLLVERGTLGSGSTSRAAGGIRTQFGDELNVRIARRSLEAYRAFGERPGAEIDFRQDGYLFLLEEPATLPGTELLSPEEAAELCPLLRTDGLIGAAYAADGARATPDAVVQGYAAGARRHGARVLTGCEVVGIEAGVVDTTRGRIETETVVCAAGAWSAICGAMAGIELPVAPVRTQVLLTDAIDGVPPDMPLTVDLGRRYYLHPEGPGLLVGFTEAHEPAGFDQVETDGWAEGLMAAASRRTPAICECGLRGGWAGWMENTPDHNALIGEVDGFFYAAGFSGHGFMQAPAVGEIVRDLVLGAEPFADVTALAAERFALGRARPERNVV
jgi:sarcosine oxidase subunit beta